MPKVEHVLEMAPKPQLAGGGNRGAFVVPIPLYQDLMGDALERGLHLLAIGPALEGG
jgi:hypothetical protein